MNPIAQLLMEFLAAQAQIDTRGIQDHGAVIEPSMEQRSMPEHHGWREYKTQTTPLSQLLLTGPIRIGNGQTNYGG